MVFLWQCIEKTNPMKTTTSSKHSELYKGDPKVECCNNNFPGYTDTATDSSELNCPVCISSCRTIKLYCANLWSEIATEDTTQLSASYCAKLSPDYPDEPSWCTAEKDGNYADVEWQFIYCHKYKLYRKILGKGSWSLRTIISNCLSEGNCGNNRYSDYIGEETDVLYKVATLNFTTQSAGYSPSAFTGEQKSN